MGISGLGKTLAMAKEAGLLVIVDGKRNDIGSTAAAYAEVLSGRRPVGGDALTVNPYLGEDGLKPFIDRCRDGDKGLFILLRTSNPSAGDLQDLLVQGRPPLSSSSGPDRWLEPGNGRGRGVPIGGSGGGSHLCRRSSSASSAAAQTALLGARLRASRGNSRGCGLLLPS